MQKTKPKHIAHKGLKQLLLFLTFVGMGVGSLFAVELGKKMTFPARVKINPPPTAPINLLHIPLQGVSAVTRNAYIQGEVGANPEEAPKSFPQRLKAFSSIKVGGDPDIRVRLRFRVTSPGGGSVDTTEYPPIEGPDPMSFVFQISPSSITVGVLEYQIIAERLMRIGGELKPVQTIYFPTEAASNPDVFYPVNVQASAGKVIGVEGGQVVSYEGNPNIGNNVLNVPAGTFSSPTAVSFSPIPPDSPVVPTQPGLPEPVAVYQMQADAFVGGSVQVTVLYPDFVYPNGPDGILDGTEIPVEAAALAFWDGFEWRKIGGFRDGETNTLTARVGFSEYLAVMPLGAMAPQDSRPLRRVITPNGDGTNDFADFQFSNPLESVTVEIFDITGHRIRTLRGAGNLRWYGRDDSGKTLESGVYIYQYKVGGTRISGVIAVAK